MAGLTYSFQNLITFSFAMLLPLLVKPLGQKITHQLCLSIGGGGLIALSFIHGAENQIYLFAVMGAVGIAWASILSMPYAMLADCLPSDKIGVYMGIFNFFIVLPEIIAALSFAIGNWFNAALVLVIIASVKIITQEMNYALAAGLAFEIGSRMYVTLARLRNGSL